MTGDAQTPDARPRPLDGAERHALARMAQGDRGPDEELRRHLGITARPRRAPAAPYLDALLARRDAGGHADRVAAPAATGDARAREELVEALLPQVVGQARRLAGTADFADLVQEGVLGALEALARFDPARGVPFGAYAAPWMRGAMLRLAQDHRRALRLPPRARVDLSALKDAAAALAGEGRGEPPLALVAARAGMPLERAEQLTRAERRPRSLDAPVGAADGGEDLRLADVLPDPAATEAYDAVVERASTPELGALLGALSGREREVLERRFGLGGREPESLGAVGEALGISRERVRQIEARAIEKLRGA